MAAELGARSVTVYVLVGTQGYLDRFGGLQEVMDGPQAGMLLGGIGAAVALAALVWSGARGTLQMPGGPR